VLCPILGTACLFAAAPVAAAQDADAAGDRTARALAAGPAPAGAADRSAADHAGHADLHRPGPSAAAIEIVAIETLGDLDRDAGALCQAARLALTAGLLSEGRDAQMGWFRVGGEYARQAERLRPDSPDALFALAAAIGLEARHQSIRDRIRTADRVQELTERILTADPDHPGGLYLRGKLALAAMRLNPMTRFMVERVLGSDVVAQSSWEGAERDLRRALAIDPDDPSPRFEVAMLLRDTRRPDEARAELQRILHAPGTAVLTEYYRERAREALDEMAGREN